MNQWIAQRMGQKFGMLTVEGEAPKHGVGHGSKTCAWFRCDCGKLVSKVLSRVISGHVKSCGCYKKIHPSRIIHPDKVQGKRFHRLVAQRQMPTKGHLTQWECLCDCGAMTIVSAKHLLNGHTKSCGCFQRDQAGMAAILSKAGIRASNWKGVDDMSGSLWGAICKGAEIRGLTITVTHQECADLFREQGGKCALTGCAIWFPPIGGEGREGTASLDRIDSTKGYVQGNLQWIHKDLQKMKWDLDQMKFIEWCRAVVDFHESKNHVVGI